MKIRGFRIELEEVEMAASSMSTVTQAAAALKQDPSGDPHLILYACPEGLDKDTMKEEMRKVLPYYMVPSLVVVLSHLPLLPSGKVDRKALPEPQWTHQGGKDYIPPRNTLEHRIQKVWEDVLSVKNVSIHTDFFQIGGDSLKAGMISAKLRQMFGVQVPGLLVFKFKTIASLSDALMQVTGGELQNIENFSPESREIPPGPAGFTDEQLGAGVPVSYNQCRMLALYEADPMSTAYNLGVCLRLKGQPDVNAFNRSLNLVVQRHEVLRMRYRRVKEDWQQFRVAAKDAMDLKYIELTERRVPQTEISEHIDSILKDHAVRPFDLFSGPLVRAIVIKVKEDEFRWMICTHHVAFDAMSTMILAHEISAAYSSFIQGDECTLPPLSLQYHDYASWQHQMLMDCNSDVDYWVQQLQGAPTVISLPSSGERSAPQGSAPVLGTINVSVPRDLVRRLNQLGLDNGATLYMILLAAFSLVLSRASGQSDVVIGCPFAAGRIYAELLHLVGYFANPLPLRVTVPSCSTFKDLLLHAKQTVLSGFQHGHVPFHTIVEATGAAYDAEVHPLYQAVLVLHDDIPADTGMEIDGLEVQVMSDVCTRRHSKLDLTLELSEMDSCLVGTLEYNADKYGHTVVESWMHEWMSVLELAQTKPDVNVDQIFGIMLES